MYIAVLHTVPPDLSVTPLAFSYSLTGVNCFLLVLKTAAIATPWAGGLPGNSTMEECWSNRGQRNRKAARNKKTKEPTDFTDCKGSTCRSIHQEYNYPFPLFSSIRQCHYLDKGAEHAVQSLLLCIQTTEGDKGGKKETQQNPLSTSRIFQGGAYCLFVFLLLFFSCLTF